MLKLDWKELLVLVLPFMVRYEVNLGGRLFLLEILFIFLVIPLVLTRVRTTPLTREIKIVILLMITWLVALMVSDGYRDSDFIDYSRGWAKISVTIVNIVVLYYLIDTPKKLLIWLASSAWVDGLTARAGFSEDFAIAWKYGLGSMFLMAGICAVFFFHRHAFRMGHRPNQYAHGWHPAHVHRSQILQHFSAVFFAGFALNLVFNARAGSAICLLTAIVLLALSIERFREGLKRVDSMKWGLYLLLAVFLVYGLTYLYIHLAMEGYLGEAAEYKLHYTMLGEVSVLGFITGGRREVVIALEAIARSPFIGYGSWAKNAEFANMLVVLSGLEGSLESRLTAQAADTMLIPTHSTIFGSWVEAGIFGAIPWLYVLYLILKRLRTALELQDVTDYLIYMLGFGFVWSLLFSPFGAEMRLAWAFRIIIILGGSWQVYRQYEAADEHHPEPARY